MEHNEIIRIDMITCILCTDSYLQMKTIIWKTKVLLIDIHKSEVDLITFNEVDQM